MKYLFASFIIMLSAPLSQAANTAATDYQSALVAFHLAKQLHEIKSPEDLLTFLPLNSADQLILKNEINSKKMVGFLKPMVKMKSLNQIVLTIQSKDYSLDFKDYGKNMISLQGKPLPLGPKKTLLNYRVDIDQVLRQNKKSAEFNFLTFIQPKAHAEGEGWIANLMAAMMSSASYFAPTTAKYCEKAQPSPTLLEPCEEMDLEGVLIGTYQAEAQHWQAYKKKKYDEPVTFLKTEIFSCKEGRLDKVEQSIIRFDKNPPQKSRSGMTLTFDPKSGYIFSDPDRKCQSIADLSGSVAQSAPGCPIQGSNLLEDYPFYQFPKVAAACCQKQGCYEKVSAGTKDIWQKLSADNEPERKRATPDPQPAVR